MLNVAETTEADLQQLTNLFGLLSDKTRLHILMLLAEGERNVSSLCAQLSLPQPTVSHHLGLLRMHNIIGNRRSGKQVFYTLNGRMDLNTNGDVHVKLDRFTVAITSKPVD